MQIQHECFKQQPFQHRFQKVGYPLVCIASHVGKDVVEDIYVNVQDTIERNIFWLDVQTIPMYLDYCTLLTRTSKSGKNRGNYYKDINMTIYIETNMAFLTHKKSQKQEYDGPQADV